MRALKRMVTGSAVCLVFVALLPVTQGVTAEPGKAKTVTLFSGDRAFCTRLFNEAHRIEYIVPMLPSPQLVLYDDTRTRQQERQEGVHHNRVYMVDRFLEKPQETIPKLFLDAPDWRKRFFALGSPQPPKKDKLAYALHYAPDGFWTTLLRRNPTLLLRRFKSSYGFTTWQAPKEFALYAVDLDGDGQAENVLYRRFDDYSVTIEAQYFDIIDITTAKQKTILIERNTKRYGYVRFRGQVYLMGRSSDTPDPHVWLQATMVEPRMKRLEEVVCDFRGIHDLRSIWKRNLKLKRE